MKAKLLTKANALLAWLLTLLGFNGCGFFAEKYGVPVEYGVPHADFSAIGTITDEDKHPLENIRVQVKYQGQPLFGDYMTTYTDHYGMYDIEMGFFEPWGTDSLDIVVSDTANVYQADSVRLPVELDRSKATGSWNMGAVEMHADFQLSKKNNVDDKTDEQTEN